MPFTNFLHARTMIGIMKKERILIALFIILFTIPVVQWVRMRPLHPELNGPISKTVIPEETKLNLADFPKSSDASLALVIVDEQSRWPDLVSVLKAHGIALSLYKKVEEAKKHKVMFVYPAISGKLLSATELEWIKKYVRDGGNIIATNVLGGGLQEVFGFRALTEGMIHKTIKLQDESIQFSSDKKEDALGSYSYTEPKKAIATFEDGTAAILNHQLNKGHSLLIGFDIGDLAYLSNSGRAEDMNYPYVNDFVNGVDPLMKLIKAFYRDHEPKAVTLGTVPFDKELTLLMTHDVDFRESVDHALAYARSEEKLGVKATFFAQTKYVNDFGDEIFFRDGDIRNYNRIKKLGMELGSHSVSHSRVFIKFKIGTGEEKYPEYTPFNENWFFTKQGTVLGELRVSKFLLDQKVKAQDTVSFRAGELKDPPKLPQALESTGYKYDSTGTTGNHLTNFPIRLTYNRRGLSYVKVFRFPVTIEDEMKPPLFERLQSSNETCEKVAKLKAVCTILVHPNIRGQKLDYVVETIKYWKDRAHFSTVKDFGDWWSTRDELKVNIIGNSIQIESTRTMKGLPLELPNGKTKLVDLESGMNSFEI
jgi:peptidoglycan/xylan/chitin deacetylase (PgdA/CDA1 family)